MAAKPLPLRQRAEQLAAVLPPLLVAAERVASTVAQGVHGRRRVGQGETFWQFRRYESGDSPQHVDWRQSAKSDHVFVRELEWEAAQSVWIWRDTSPSMTWRSSDNLPDKRQRADLLALALIVLLLRSGEHVALLGSNMRPSSSRATLSRLSAAIENDAGNGDSLPPVLPLPRNGQVVFIGDFLDPLDDIDRRFRGYAESGLKAHIVQVFDPAEESLPFGGRIRFAGLEGEDPWLLSNVAAVRDEYIKRFTAQRAGLQAIAKALGWGFSSHCTSKPPEAALLSLYMALSQNVA